MDIIRNVHRKLGAPIDYAAIPDDSDLVLSPFRSGDLEKIFVFDQSPDALIMKYENYLPGYSGVSKLQGYVKSQNVDNFRDVLNISAIWLPNSKEKVVDLVLDEVQWTFCQPHTVAFGQFVKQTAVLKSLYRDLYFREIEDWEKRHSFKWDDIGVRFDGVSLLQN